MMHVDSGNYEVCTTAGGSEVPLLITVRRSFAVLVDGAGIKQGVLFRHQPASVLDVVGTNVDLVVLGSCGYGPVRRT